mmetsp:Transcript_73204/g.174464  ORF Transcript_73204/g.174464 Transcript_73204/m.174464 type:complete len:203 (+) Transcript_73204:947-1555(+)
MLRIRITSSESERISFSLCAPCQHQHARDTSVTVVARGDAKHVCHRALWESLCSPSSACDATTVLPHIATLPSHSRSSAAMLISRRLWWCHIHWTAATSSTANACNSPNCPSSAHVYNANRSVPGPAALQGHSDPVWRKCTQHTFPSQLQRLRQHSTALLGASPNAWHHCRRRRSGNPASVATANQHASGVRSCQSENWPGH